MFGEIPLVGEEIIDVKNRSIKLPAYSNVEPNEKLCFLKLDNEIRLYSEKEYDNFLEIFFDVCKNKKISSSKIREFKLVLCAKFYDEKKVNSKKTISSKFITEDTPLIFVGADNHIKILTKEQYGLYKQKNKM